MSIDLPTPIGLKLLSGLLGNNGPGHNGQGHGVGGADGNDPDSRADQSRQNALQNERNAEASNDQGRWGQSDGADGVRHGHHHDGGDGPRGPGNNNGVGNGGLPNPGDLLSNALGKTEGAIQNLLGGGGQESAGPLGKLGDLTTNLLNPGGHLPPGTLAKALDAVPLGNLANAAGTLLTQATAQALNAPGAQALAARNALHDAASAPLAPPRDAPAALQTANSNLTHSVPAAARAADGALIQNRQDLLPMARADQAALGRTATALPASAPPPAAPALAVEPARVLPFAAPPPAVPASQSPTLVDGRPNPMGSGGGDGSVGAAQKADMAQQTPPGHTGAAPARAFRREEEEGESLAKKMIQALAVWMGLAPAPKAAEAEADDALPAQAGDDRWLRLQWLFWALAVAGYGCLAIAVIVFIPGGAGFLDETRNPIVRPALVVGLGCSIAAWWLARKIARSR